MMFHDILFRIMLLEISKTFQKTAGVELSLFKEFFVIKCVLHCKNG